LAELQAVPNFDYVVVNNDLERCVERIRAIVEHEDGVVSEGHMPDIEAYRSEIGRILDEEYSEYVNR
jgi:guanylate kinase